MGWLISAEISINVEAIVDDVRLVGRLQLKRRERKATRDGLAQVSGQNVGAENRW